MSLIEKLLGKFNAEDLPSHPFMMEMMSRYQTKDLVNTDPKSFKEKIDGFLALSDYKMEGFSDAEKQRDLTVKFSWGHNHDFGDFFLKGRLTDRHVRLLATFMDKLNALPRSLEGKRVLDIGCWTGGTSLILCAMGAEVVAIEEVKKYTESLNYLKHAFDIKKLDVRNLSLYEFTADEFQDSFDIVLFCGVLYHITDLVLALRIIFNALKDGGTCLLETAALKSNKMTLSYEGPAIMRGRNDGKSSRGGWNWFMPSTAVVVEMMKDVGFADVQTQWLRRLHAVGRRDKHVDIMRSGLSVKNIR